MGDEKKAKTVLSGHSLSLFSFYDHCSTGGAALLLPPIHLLFFSHQSNPCLSSSSLSTTPSPGAPPQVRAELHQDVLFIKDPLRLPSILIRLANLLPKLRWQLPMSHVLIQGLHLLDPVGVANIILDEQCGHDTHKYSIHGCTACHREHCGQDFGNAAGGVHAIPGGTQRL